MSICMLVFCILIFGIYLIKDKTRNQNTLKFKLAQLVVIWCLLFNLFAINIFSFYGIDSWQDKLLSRVYIWGFLLFFNSLEEYFLSEVFGYDNEMFNFKKNKLSAFIIGLFTVSTILIFTLPNNIYWDGAYKFAFNGIASTYTYIICFGYQIVNFVIGIIRRNEIDKEKLISIFIIPILFIGAIFLYNIADYSFFEMAMVLSVAVVYFSIAKPDQKIQVDIEKSIVDLEKASRFKSDFISNTSHDLKTPLNAIMGTVVNLLDMHDLKSNTKKNLLDILYASNVLYETISNILLISKMEQPDYEFNKQVYNLKDEVYSLPAISKIRHKKIAINFGIEVENNVPDLLYGEREIILAIIDNTLSYSNVHVNDGSVYLTISWNDQTNELVIQVNNECSTSGNLYANLDESLVDIYESINNTDFAINLAALLTKRLNGKIDFSYENGSQNSIFYTIPQEKNKEQYSYQNITYEGKKVLLVDDSEVNLKIVDKQLKSLSIDATTIDNGASAIDLVKTNDFDLILLDINMTNMNGVETLQKLKEIDGFNIPVIALTADDSLNAYKTYIEAGFDDYLVKPFLKSDLISHLEKFFKGGNK